MSNFSSKYCSIISDIMENGIEETNTRTGMKVKALPGVQFQVNLEKEFPLLTARKIRIENFVAEMMWFISGQKDTNVFLRDHTKIWDLFTEEDGTVGTAYGYRWRHTFGRDQLKDLVDLLERDPSSRHGVVVTWDPSYDGLGGVPQKNIPCPYTWTVNIIGGRLHLHNIIRSNDMILGAPTDAAGFAFLALMLAQRLGVKPGIYTQSISNAHIYENHYKAAKEINDRYFYKPFETVHPIELPEDALNRAILLDEDFFAEVVDLFKEEYRPMPSISGLLISP